MDYVSNQLRKNNPQDLSLRGVTNSTEPTGGKVGTAFYDNNIPQQSVVVNPELPHISSLYEGLTPFQSGQLESKGSLIGSGIDWANNLLRGGAIRRSALNLLNPSFNGVPARESFVVRNPSLSAGLTPTALNNLGFYQNQ